MILKWNITNQALRKKCIDKVITRIEELDGNQVGEITSQDIIDIVTENFGPEIYNTGLSDAKKLLQERFNDIEIGLDLLEQM